MEVRKCLNCGKDITNPKFCNNSCAAKFNCKGRIRTSESKEKVKKSLKVFYNSTIGIELKKNTSKKIANIKTQRESEGIIYKNSKKNYKQITCSYCKSEFKATRKESGRWPTLCSDICFIKMKAYNAKGIKRQEYKGLIFDSGWEVKLAKWLDENNITWSKPSKAEFWFDSTGRQRKYFADFYLPKYNIFLDPKNPFCIKQQQEKLNVIEKQIDLIYGTPEFIIEKIKNLLV